MERLHRVVIIGGGFGGLSAALALKRAPAQVTLVDRRNFHLFQPLLYQVATGGLSPSNIAAPLRGVLKGQRNTSVLLGDALDVDPIARRVILSDGEVHYDTLVVSTGARHHYFGNDQWEALAPALKTVEDATHIRRRIFLAFEAAERETDSDQIRVWLTFVVVGAGPTGVELAGALGEIARETLRHDFRRIKPADARILLVEAADRVLPLYPPDLSAKAQRSLERLGVTVMTGWNVVGVQPHEATLKSGEKIEAIPTRTVLWAAGVMGSELGRAISKATSAQLDRAGRINVNPDLSIPGYPEIFVIGDLACCLDRNSKLLPGVAPVAMQQGRYTARVIQTRLKGQTTPPFRYWDKGNLATIGRAAAVADFGRLHVSGWPAWMTWLFVHLMYLVEYQNRLLVLVQWAWNYFTFSRSSRLITGENPLPLDL